MALKVALCFFLVMLLFTQNNARKVGGYAQCMMECIDGCAGDNMCIVGCAYCLIEDGVVDELPIQTRVCNVGCSIGHCYKFLIKYDESKFGNCMTGCKENYCLDNTAAKKA